jgi:hypothetical protein
MDQEGKITINDKEYKASELTQEQINIVYRIQDLQGRKIQLTNELSDLTYIIDLRTQQLKTSLENNDGPTDSPDKSDP